MNGLPLMNGLRIVMVTRRFWPLIGGAEMVMSNLAEEFCRLGATTRVLTAQWQPNLPTEFVHRNFAVSRLPNPPGRGWGTFRYMNALRRWLVQNRGEIDLVYVSMLKHDAYAAVSALSRHRIPVVLRAEGAGETGDCQWQRNAKFGGRIKRRTFRAAAFVAPSQEIHDEMVASGYDEGRMHLFPNGVPVGEQCSPERRRQARWALADVNPEFSLPEHAQLAVYTGRLDPGKGLGYLVAAWRTIVNRWPNARLWLVGQGPYRVALTEQIESQGLGANVFLPGVFDCVDGILHAADAFILPSLREGLSLSLLEAMAVGLPVVASDIPGNRELVRHEQTGLLVPTKQVDALSQAITRLFDEQHLSQKLGSAARSRVQEHFSLAQAAKQHGELFQRLLARSR